MRKFLVLCAVYALMTSAAFGVSSSDTELILSRLDRISARLDGVETRLSAVEKKVDGLAVEISHTNDRLEDLRHMIYWGFAIIGIVIALIALPRGGGASPKEKGNSGGVTVSDMIAFFKFAKEKEKV